MGSTPLLRLAASLAIHLGYRFEAYGTRHIPEHGPALLVCNHVTFVDSLFVGLATRRPVRFVMHEHWLGLPGLGFVFRRAGVIPIASARQNPERLERAMDAIAAALGRGELVCIFPEGKLTKDGAMDVFRRGVERILARSPVPVVPMALRGMWGSVFSLHGGGPFRAPPQRFRARAELHCGAAIDPARVTADSLRAEVATLRGVFA